MVDTVKLHTTIANMVAFGVSQRQIADTVDLDESRISQIMDTDEYKAIQTVVLNDTFEFDHEMNEGWDTVEAKALSIIHANLDWNKDPEFALKAAAMSNRAKRRGNLGNNNPIVPQDAGRVIINLSQRFVTQVQADEKVLDARPRAAQQLEQHVSDTLAPQSVEKFLTPKALESDDEKVARMFSDVDMAQA